MVLAMNSDLLLQDEFFFFFFMASSSALLTLKWMRSLSCGIGTKAVPNDRGAQEGTQGY